MNPPKHPFTLGEWRVQPQLNRLEGTDGHCVQVEPKMMDVLVRLAEAPGEVVSRETLIDAVWPEVFISESVLTRAIAGLRRALGDDARRPRFIETISKRGYRLIGVEHDPVRHDTLQSGQRHPGGSYVVGQWVRAEAFYGRTAQLAEVLDGPRNGFWVVGTRRRGKTSFLKQLEHLSATQPERRLAPVFWDLQGVDGVDALSFSLEEALADAEPVLEKAGIAIDDVIENSVFRVLGTLRRRARSAGWTVLLLCDEAETLRSLRAGSEAVIGQLRRVLLAQDGVRTVLASGPRLWDLATGSETSPFLDGFLPPLYLGPLAADDAEALLRQKNVAGATSPTLSEKQVAEVRRWAAGHPFLLQLLGKRVVELGSVEAAVSAVSGDRSVTSLFEIDLALLDAEQQKSLLAMALGHRCRSETVGPGLLELAELGLIEQDSGGWRVALPMLRDWLARAEPRR